MRMRYFIMIAIAATFVFLYGCSGKTTVKEEIVDTSAKKDTAAVDQTQNTQDEQQAPSTDEEKASGEENKGGEETPSENPDRHLAPGENPQNPTPEVPVPNDKTEQGGGTADREAYLNKNMIYPGGEETRGLQPPMGSGASGKTLLTPDQPDKVIEYYQKQFPGKVQVNKVGEGQNTSTQLIINDTDYTSHVIISRTSNEGKTRIILHVADKK